MRNLAEHPVTTGEIEECLGALSAGIVAEGRTGDMRPLLLAEASKIVRRAANPLPDFFLALAEAARASEEVDGFDLRSEDPASALQWKLLLDRQREAVADLLRLSAGKTADILVALGRC